MKTSCLFILIFLFVGTAWADAYSSFSAAVDFNASMKDLVEKPASIDPTKLYMLDGTVSGVRVIKTDPNNFYAEVDFMRAEWENLESIKTYHVVLVFSKPGFAKLIPARAPPNPNFGQIVPNSRGIAVVSFVNTVTSPRGTVTPVFMVQDYRALR